MTVLPAAESVPSLLPMAAPPCPLPVPELRGKQGAFQESTRLPQSVLPSPPVCPSVSPGLSFRPPGLSFRPPRLSFRPPGLPFLCPQQLL